MEAVPDNFITDHIVNNLINDTELHEWVNNRFNNVIEEFKKPAEEFIVNVGDDGNMVTTDAPKEQQYDVIQNIHEHGDPEDTDWELTIQRESPPQPVSHPVLKEHNKNVAKTPVSVIDEDAFGFGNLSGQRKSYIYRLNQKPFN